MQITVIVDKSAFDAAIAVAERIGLQNERVKGLEAPVDGALFGWVEEAWEAVRRALDRAYQFGADAATEAVQTAEKVIDRVMSDAGKRASEVAAALRAKIAGYVAGLIDEMLKQVRPNLKIGEGTLKLSEVQISQKLVIGGSLKASLKEALALTSSSEFNIDASYKA
jgi:hypothetical protein